MTSIEKRVMWVLLCTLVLGIAALEYRNRVARPRLRVIPTAQVDSLRAGKVNLNTAEASQLERLPGIGPKLAQRIIAYRNEHGEFSSLRELTQVSGIGPKTLEELAPHLTTE